MIDVMENIKKLSAALDAETASLHPSGKLLLLGSQDSVFLKAIKRKADQLGINCDHTSNPLPPYRGRDGYSSTFQNKKPVASYAEPGCSDLRNSDYHAGYFLQYPRFGY